MVQRSKKNLRTGSEYGGLPGLVQPPPHDPTPNESLMMMYQTNPAANPQHPETEEMPPPSQKVAE